MAHKYMNFTFEAAEIMFASRRAWCVTFLMTVETTPMKVHAVTTWHVATLKRTCVTGGSKLMMNLTGPKERARLHPLTLDLPGTIPWAPRQVGISIET